MRLSAYQTRKSSARRVRSPAITQDLGLFVPCPARSVAPRRSRRQWDSHRMNRGYGEEMPALPRRTTERGSLPKRRRVTYVSSW